MLVSFIVVFLLFENLVICLLLIKYLLFGVLMFLSMIGVWYIVLIGLFVVIVFLINLIECVLLERFYKGLWLFG